MIFFYVLISALTAYNFYQVFKMKKKLKKQDVEVLTLNEALQKQLKGTSARIKQWRK